ncbi:MAG: choice-of-anchor L domain-containing protein [Crocinitomicaceae bacterium]|nr:choice-of-anchor L domain-containing protein [Crocinitomicaceae bacterium]
MKYLILISTLFFSISAFAQLNTYTGNVGFVINPGFLGPNYQLSNVQYTGHPQAIGSFICDSCNLNLEKGVILTTGAIETDSGPQGPNDNPAAAIANGYGGTSLINDSYNAAVLEFDIYSFVDTIQFRYVFGSDEYPEYVGSQFNDQFRIFIEGPGIVGIQDLNYIPSGIYAGINTINAQTNSGYFVDNGEGSTAPNNQSDYYIQYDGFTIPLMAKVAVQAGQTYHLTIVVADKADQIFDSGVFLEQCEECDYNASVPNDILNQISCYPNPSSGNVTLKFPELTSSGELRVLNYLGQLVRTIEVSSGATELFLNELPVGNFVLEISTEDAIWRGKVSVE